MDVNKPIIEFSQTISVLISERENNNVTVFSGINNSGKTFLMKGIHYSLGERSYFLACQRFFNNPYFPSRIKELNEQTQLFNGFMNNFDRSTSNEDNNYRDLNAVITGLKDKSRDTLLEICTELFGEKFTLKNVHSDNKMSPLYIDVEGTNLSYTSTGTRLLVIILAFLLDDSYEFILLDEPELGLTPSLQSKLSKLIFNKELRVKYFSHLKHIYVSTHSHLFLDKEEIKNNFILDRNLNSVNIKQIKNFDELNRLKFNLLGNTLESLFLPALILLVEGKTDFSFVRRVLNIKFPNSNIVCIECQGTRIRENLFMLKQLIGDIQKSPYRNRVMVILDKTHQTSIVSDLVNDGVQKDNVIVWKKNGIEYYYPETIIRSIFSCTFAQYKSKIGNSDKISVNGIVKTKVELNSEVLAKLDSDSIYVNEFNDQLIERIKKLI